MVISEWPSIICTERRSAPCERRCVAKEWRRLCGETSCLMPAARVASLMICQNRSRVIPLPRFVTKRVLQRLPFKISGRDDSRYDSMASFAGIPKGIRRSFSPFPKTRTKQDKMLQLVTGNVTSSVTRNPVEYKSCNMV